MNYIDSSEYAAFGLSTIAIDRIDNASAVVDAYLSRPEGIIYASDPNGLPIHMARKLPEGSFKLKSALSPGTNVTAHLSAGPILVAGSSLVLDRPDPGKVETVSVKSVIDSTHVILMGVVYDHDIGCVVEDGMCIDATMTVSKGRSYVTLPSGPIRRLISAVGRVGYPRRGDSLSAISPVANGLIASVSQFGGAPMWQIINVGLSDIDVEKNQIWTPMGFLMSPYSDVRVSYIAGYPVDSVPMGIKRATANIARAINESPAGASVSMFKAGEVQMERFIDSVIDEDLRMMLSPFRVSVYA